MARIFTRATPHYLEYASAAIISAEPLTIAGWGRSDSITVNQVVGAIWSFEVGGSEGWRIRFSGAVASDPIEATHTQNGGATGTSASATGYSANVWTHAAGVFASTTSRIAYKDGVAGTENTTLSQTSAGIDRTLIGARYENTPAITDAFSGDIAEVGFWNVALTAGEVAALAKGVRPLLIRPASLVAYYPIMGRYSPEINLVDTTVMTVTGAAQSAHPLAVYPRRRMARRFKPAAAAGGITGGPLVGGRRINGHLIGGSLL